MRLINVSKTNFAELISREMVLETVALIFIWVVFLFHLSFSLSYFSHASNASDNDTARVLDTTESDDGDTYIEFDR